MLVHGPGLHLRRRPRLLRVRPYGRKLRGWGPGARGQQLDLARHGFGELFVEDANARQIPAERGYRISGFEQIDTRGIPLFLVVSQRVVRSVVDRIGEQFRVAQRIRDAVGSQRVLEVSGVTDQRPAGSVRASKKPGLTGKSVKAGS